MRIGIDASRFSETQATGVENYSHYIIEEIVKQNGINSENEIILYSKSPIKIEGKYKCRVMGGKRLWTIVSLSWEMHKNPPDVLFVPSHVLPMILPRKSVITIHDLAFRHLKKSYSFFQYHYLNWSAKFAVKHATKIIVPSKATAEDLEYFYHCEPSKIEVIPHGYKSPELAEKASESSETLNYFNIKKDSDFLLFVGRLESKKNLCKLLEAFSDFVKNHPTFLLVLAGKRGLGFERIWKTVNELDLVNKVIMPGYINDSEKDFLFKNCKVFVFPSLYEGFGLPILEAFHYKKPVLASNVSSIPEVGGDAVSYVDPYDAKTMESGLEKLISDEKYVEELVNLGTERLKLFSWRAAAKKILGILKKC